jgi:seryl-tRNA synthetase
LGKKPEELGLKALNGGKAWKRLKFLFGGRLKIVRVCSSTDSSKPNKTRVLCDQILDSIIVAGITGVSTFVYAGQDASLKAALLSFLLTFLIKMKEYRKIS